MSKRRLKRISLSEKEKVLDFIKKEKTWVFTFKVLNSTRKTKGPKLFYKN